MLACGVTFPCPGCAAPISRSPERPLLRCHACGARLRARAAGSTPATRRYDVEVVGRPQTRRQIELEWGAEDARRLRRWLVWSTLLTLGLIGVLFAVARLSR